MKVVENENAIRIIKALVPEKILGLNPVIAGGFVVSLYHLAMRYSSPIYDADLTIKIERATNKKVWTFVSEKILSELGLNKKFGDVDFWFLKDNKIWEEKHPARFLLADFVSDEEMIEIISPPTPPVGVFVYPAKSYSGRKTFKNVIKDYPNLFSLFGLSEEIKNSSYWANTFVTDLKSAWNDNSSTIVNELPIQIVKKSYETIDELFTKFDMLNCCAAYYDGKFYFHDDFEDCTNQHIIKAGDSFFKPTTLGKIWSANRSFKYAQRFELEFSEEVCNSITETFVESEILLDKIKNLQPSELINLGEVEEINDPYGKNGTVSVFKLNGMIMSLFNSAPVLFSMKAFDKDQLFAFINSPHHAVKTFVKDYIEKESENFRQIQELEQKQELQKITLDEKYASIFEY